MHKRIPSLSRAHFDLAAAMTIVGSMTVAGKMVLAEFPLHLSMGLRFLFASLLALLWLYAAEGGLPRVSGRTLLLLAAQAACGVYLTNWLMLLGLGYTSAASAGIITATTPAAMALLARLFLGESVSRRSLAGICVAVLGVLALSSGHIRVLLAGTASGEAGSAMIGNLLMLGVVFAESAFLLIRKNIREPLSPLAATTYVSLLGLLLFAPQAVLEARGFDFGAVSLQGWLVVAYYGALVSVGAYWFWFRGVVRVDAATAGVFTAVMPVSALFFSWLVLGERLGPEHLAGCALVVLAIRFICARPTGVRAAASRP